MMLTAASVKEMEFALLMDVYIQSNMQKAEEGISLHEAEQDFYLYLRDDFFRQKDARYFIWEENGSYLSALRLEPYKDGWLLEALETAPQHRRKGYGEKLLCQVISLPEYDLIYSHIHKQNIPSLRLHEKCGFCMISSQATYIDGSVNSRACTMLFRKSHP